MDQFFEEEEIQKIKTIGWSEEFIEGAKSCHKTEAPPASKIARWTPESVCAISQNSPTINKRYSVIDNKMEIRNNKKILGHESPPRCTQGGSRGGG